MVKFPVLKQIRYPASAQIFNTQMIKIATFDFLSEFEEMGYDVLGYFLELPDESSVGENFIEVGYESIYFVRNLGTLFFVIFGYIAIFIFIGLLFVLKFSKHLERLRKKLKGIFMWNSVIRLLIEGYFEIVLAIGITTIYI